MATSTGTDAAGLARPSSVPFQDLSRHVVALRPAVDAAIATTLDGGRFILGEQVRAFEREFAAYCGVGSGIGVASGTDALTLALAAAGVTTGDEVAVTGNMGLPPITAIVNARALPLLVDIDPVTFAMDPARLEARITPRTRAVLVVHPYGQCADMDALLEVARRHAIPVVEDCAHTHGARYGDRVAGSMGTVACFSFYPTKNLGAFGDGGMIVTDDPEIAERVRRLRSYGEQDRYQAIEHGWNSRLDELQAAILRVKLPLLDGGNERRREIARAYDAALAGGPVTPPAVMPGRRHVYHLYVVRAADRDRLRRRLEVHGVQALVHYPAAAHRQAAYPQLAAQAEHCPETERACAEVLSLPLYPDLRDDEVERVIDALRG